MISCGGINSRVLQVMPSWLSVYREVDASFGNSCDEQNLELIRFYQEVAYGILAELVAHVLKMNIEPDGVF